MRRLDLALVLGLAVFSVIAALSGVDPAWPAACLVMAGVIVRTA